ncbi:MAG: hypothetical protein U0R50_02505 [Gaiellales bacterium]
MRSGTAYLASTSQPPGGGTGDLAEHVASISLLASVDADSALAPPGADAGEPEARVGIRGDARERRLEQLSIPWLELELLVGVRHIVGQGDARVRVAGRQDDVGGRDANRVGHNPS